MTETGIHCWLRTLPEDQKKSSDIIYTIVDRCIKKYPPYRIEQVQ